MEGPVIAAIASASPFIQGLLFLLILGIGALVTVIVRNFSKQLNEVSMAVNSATQNNIETVKAISELKSSIHSTVKEEIHEFGNFMRELKEQRDHFIDDRITTLATVLNRRVDELEKIQAEMVRINCPALKGKGCTADGR